MNDVRILKRKLETVTRKYNAEISANKSLINANTVLVDKERLLMFDNERLKEEIEYLKLNNPEKNLYLCRVVKENKRKIDNLRINIKNKDKEIERLNKELQDTKEHLGEYLHEQEEENKRLNNIINELEKELQEDYKIWMCNSRSNGKSVKFGIDVCQQHFYRRLQELKENNYEGINL